LNLPSDVNASLATRSIDIGSMLGGVVYAVNQQLNCSPPRPFVSKATVLCVASGTALFPLAMLAMAVVSDWFTERLKTNARFAVPMTGKTK
jgi:hypothetical protein